MKINIANCVPIILVAFQGLPVMINLCNFAYGINVPDKGSQNHKNKN